MKGAGALFIRIIALLGDLGLAYALYSYLNSYSLFREFYEDIITRFSGFQRLSDLIATAILVYVLHILLRFYSTLIFSVSLCQLILGVRVQGHALWKRVAGGARVVFEAFLSPFLIFDLPILFGKKSIKEVLSFTNFYRTNQTLSAFFAVVLLPLSLLLVLYSPLLENLTLIDGIELDFGREKNEPISNETNFSNYKEYSSNFMSISSFSSLKDGRFIFLPTFEVIKSKKSIKVMPYMQIYDQNNKLVGSFKRLSRFSLFDLLKQGGKGNIFFKARYPRLFEVVTGDRKLFAKKLYAGEKESSLFDEDLKKETEDLVRASFELSISTVFDHLFENGPLIRGYVLVRNSFLGKIEKGSVPSVGVVQIGNQHFLVMEQSIDFWSQGSMENRETWIPIETDNSVVLQLTFPQSPDGMDSKKSLKESFFAGARWFFDYDETFPVPLQKGDYGPFYFMEAFTEKKLDEQQRELFGRYLYQYYEQVALVSLQRKDQRLQDLLISNLNRLFLVAALRNKLDKGYYSKHFLRLIRRLKVQLEQKDMTLLE